MQRVLMLLGVLTTTVGLMLTALASSDAMLPAPRAGASNVYGPGVGPQYPSLHWGGAYVLQGVPGLGYCIEPDDADPIELSWEDWHPAPYPGSGRYSRGQMAALADFAERYQSVGYGGYSVNETVAAIAQIAYGSAGGYTPPESQAPPTLVASVLTWITRYPGPWRLAVSLAPAPGGTYYPGNDYRGTVTVTSAVGNGVPGLRLVAPATGGPAEDQVSHFAWLSSSTNSNGQDGFVWSVSGVPYRSGKLSGAITILTSVPGTTPPTYAPPPTSGGQEMLVSGGGSTLSSLFSVAVRPETGTLSVSKAVDDAPYYGPAGAVFQVIDAAGSVVDTLTTGPTGATPASTPLQSAPGGVRYRIHEIKAPPGYGPAADQVTTVYPSQSSVVRITAEDEPVLSARLGAAKVDAETGQPLAGATFDFRFDSADNGVYDQDLGHCTTGASGNCQPPAQNTAGGWLPGWYQVTETAAPPGYWLDPSTAVQDVFVQPGATALATVTFADYQLGSLQLAKTGNDTAYLPVAGAVFGATGPAPSTASVGTLVVGKSGVTNTITGLVPGTYTLTETLAPAGYQPVAPFPVRVAAGHAITRATATDPVQPGSLTISKTDAATGQPLAGATFDTRFDSQDDGDFDVDLGNCTTGVSGTCAPPANDGTRYLPGRYEVIETAAPAGYSLPSPPPVSTLTLPVGGATTFSFADHLLVPASFAKVAVGNVNPAELDLAGAVIDVTPGTVYGGAAIATCTTDGSGRCTTAPALVSGRPYCWSEVTAPRGLAAGATGCFTASNAQASQPVTVVDPGTFVAVTAEKVDAGSPSTPVGGATFDLYRVDGAGGGSGTPSPVPPPDARSESGQVWVARATSGPDGVATFPLQLPGYAYCTIEHTAPPDYVADPAEQCTGVLAGTTSVPPPATTITTADREATVTVSAHKFNAASPGTGIPGAVYDLYAVGKGAPSGPPSPRPSDAAVVPGDTWWGRGTTSASGELQFTVPAGHAWCWKEHSAPVDYLLDPGLHCTGSLTTATPSPQLSVALPEALGMVNLYTHKFNALHPGTAVPGAMYELVGRGPLPPGWSDPPDPARYPVPAGDWYVGTATTDDQGVASWTVPAGYSWCMHEVTAPAGYELDTGWHCTGVVTTATPVPAETVALPEVPRPAVAASGSLAFTGGPPLWVLGAGLVLLAIGGILVANGRHRLQRRKR